MTNRFLIRVISEKVRYERFACTWISSRFCSRVQCFIVTEGMTSHVRIGVMPEKVGYRHKRFSVNRFHIGIKYFRTFVMFAPSFVDFVGILYNSYCFAFVF